jgi:hypothetical protein
MLLVASNRVRVWTVEKSDHNIQNTQDDLTIDQPYQVLFTLLSPNADAIISHGIREMEEHARLLGIPTAELQAITGQGKGTGTPQDINCSSAGKLDTYCPLLTLVPTLRPNNFKTLYLVKYRLEVSLYLFKRSVRSLNV